MSQASKLPSISKIELSVRQLRPPQNRDGSAPQLVGALDDGSPVYYGDIFIGNPAFTELDENGWSSNGHLREPQMGPDGEPLWTMNKATGQRIKRVHKSTRRYGKRKYIMKDFGNGNAGPIPVPTAQPSGGGELVSELDRLTKVLAENDMSLGDFVKALKGKAEASGEDALSLDAPEDAVSYPKHAGGPWYELSNGERVKGKEAALEAEAALSPPG